MAQAGRADTAGARAQRSKAGWGSVAIALALTGLALCARAWPVVGADVLPRGDFAADLLLADAISRGEPLLTGHYSRFGFNHPGPGFFYLSWPLAELGRAAGLSASGAWHLAAVLVNAGFAVLLAWIATRLEGIRPTAAVLALGAAAAALAFGIGAGSVWMPDRIVLPFACLMLALIGAARGELSLLIVAAGLTGLLVHGYILMVAVAVPLWLGVAAYALSRQAFRDRRAAFKAAGVSLLIAGLLALPILLEALLTTPSNFGRILDATGAFDERAAPSAVLAFLANAAGHGLPWGLAFAVPLVLCAPRVATASWSALALLAAVAGLVFAVFTLFPGRLQLFSAAFLKGVVIAGVVPFVIVALSRAEARLSGWFAGLLWPGLAAAALLALALSPQPAPVPTDPTARLVAEVAARLDADRPEAIGTAERPLVIAARPRAWVETVALVHALERRGIPVCQNIRHVLFPARNTCPDRAPTVRLLRADACSETPCDLVAGDHGIRFLPVRDGAAQ
ncbi:MAG: hypothetical protein ACFBRM_05765 [Pikeienuella sp.]